MSTEDTRIPDQCGPILARLVRWAEARDDVRAMLLYSSRARPGGSLDAFSDYDLLLEVRDAAALHCDDRWLGEVGPVLVVFKNPLGDREGLPASLFVTHYEDGLKIDFAFVQTGYLRWVSERPSLPDDLDHGLIVLVDKDNQARGLPAPSRTAYRPAPPDERTYLELIAEFFNDAAYVAKALRRGDLIPAKHSLDAVMKHECLLRMLDWRESAARGWETAPKPGGRGLLGRLDAATYAELERTYVGAGERENWEALVATIILFRRIAQDVGKELGHAYPDDQDRRMVAYLRAVRDGTLPIS